MLRKIVVKNNDWKEKLKLKTQELLLMSFNQRWF